jgi:hypothetical protein
MGIKEDGSWLDAPGAKREAKGLSAPNKNARRSGRFGEVIGARA